MAPTTAQITTENTAGQTYRALIHPMIIIATLCIIGSMKKRIPRSTKQASLGAQTGTLWPADAGRGGCPAFPRRDIEDEDSTSFDRQEQRALTGRFSDRTSMLVPIGGREGRSNRAGACAC